MRRTLPRTNAPIVQVGDLNRWITLSHVPTSVNTDGSPATPTEYATSWALIKPLTGRELDKAQQISQDVSHLVVIPYQPGVLESDLVGWENRTFLVQVIEDENEQHWQLRLLCMERGQSPA